MKLVDQLRTKWQEWTGEEDTPFDDDYSPWLTTAFIHAVVFVLLFLMPIVAPNSQLNLVSDTTEIPEEEELVEVEEVYFDEEQTEIDVGAHSLDATEAALAMAPEFAEESVVESIVEPIPDALTEVKLDLSQATAPVVSKSMTVMGARVGEGVTGAPGAVDRITYEILQSLEQRKTVVVWLFDSTLSLKKQRGSIADRFSKIYGELGLLEKSGNQAFSKHEDQPLLSVIYSYGKNVSLLTKEPTTDVKEMKKLVDAITHDKTGEERTFFAVASAAHQFREWRTRKGRNVMLIAVTDEVGSDEKHVEECIQVVRRAQMPVYVVGVPAPFGRKTVPFRYVNDDPQYEKTEYWIPVHQGPESLAPEIVKLAFWGSSREQESSELIDSGFGPYNLTRLCAETGGIYFAVHPNKTSYSRATNRGGRGGTPENTTLLYKFFDPAVMRPYAPDYVTIDGYKALLADNKARYALHRAAMLGADAIRNPMTRFVKRDEGSLPALGLEAQKQAAKLEPKLEAIYEALRFGEADRESLVRPRWKAGYDLAIGRVLAAIVRTKGYNQMVADIKSGKAFKGKNNNTWTLKHDDQVVTGSTHEKMAKQAIAYLNRVVEEHPGTPWAYLAAKELKTPLGWRWDESFTPIPKPQQGMGNGNGNAANPNDQLMKLKRKPRAPRPKL